MDRLILFLVILGSYLHNGGSVVTDECIVSDLEACDVCSCLNGGKEVGCENVNLTALPANIPKQVVILNLKNNRIACVPRDYFMNLSKLQKLDISNNNLTASFLLPKNVYEFIASNNMIEHVEDFFKFCDNMTSADLGGNPVRSISTKELEICPNVNELSLEGLLLEKLNRDTLVAFPGLNRLRMVLMPALSEIDADAFTPFCENLRRLWLRGCKELTNLPGPLLRNCSNLSVLDISDTSITSLDPELFASPLLGAISLNWNHISDLSKETFSFLDSIKNLEMSTMGLVDIPSDIFVNTSLGYLLDLAGNNLETIPLDLFSSNPSGHDLQLLVLSGNKLTAISPGTFRELHLLKELYLDGNTISQLPQGMLTGTELQSLYIFHNNIDRLSDSLFDQPPENNTLTTIFAQSNPISELSTTFLSGIVDGGNVVMSCDNVTVRQSVQKVSVECVPEDFLMEINTTSVGLRDSLSMRGFVCHYKKESFFGYSSCMACSVGTYGVPGYCVKCPKGGFYQDEVGQYSRQGYENGCKHCNAGNYVPFEGGSSPLDCKVCPDGTDRERNASYRACFCVDNYFRRDRFNSCELCPPIGANCSGEALRIRRGYYWNWAFSDIDRYRNFVENLATRNDSYDRSASSFGQPLPWIHTCPEPLTCENNDDILGSCKEGYTGWMCASCDDGFFAILGFCRQCPDVLVFVVEIAVILLIVLFLMIYVVFVHRRQSGQSGRSIVDVALARGKIVLGFYQVMGEFWGSISAIYWQEVFQNVAYLINIIQLDISAVLVKPSCFFPFLGFNPYVEFIIGVATPPTIIIACGLCLLVNEMKATLKSYYRKTPIDPARKCLANKILTLMSLGLFVTYPSTCNVIFALFKPACVVFPIDENKAKNVTLLRPDYSINCSTATHLSFETAAYACSFYVLAFPGILLCLLLKFSRGTAECPVWLRFLSENYRPGFWFWEIIELVRKVSQTLIIVVYGWDSTLSVIVTLAIAVIFLMLHASFTPMKDRFEHYLQLASLWAIFLNMLVAAVPATNDEDPTDVTNVIGVLLVFLNLVVLGIALGKPLMLMVKALVSIKILKEATSLIRRRWLEHRSSELQINVECSDVYGPSTSTPLLNAQ